MWWMRPIAGEGDLAPGTGGLGEEFGDELRGPAAEGEESDAEAVELREVGIGGEAAVEDQLAREGFRAGAPCLGEAENLVVLVLLANIGVGVGEEPGAGDAGREGADAALPSAAPGNVVLLDQGIVAVTGNGVAVEVEGFACAEIDAEAADGGVPAVHQFRPEAGVGAGGVFARGCPLGDCVQAGKESRPLVEGLGHHLGRPADPPELESEQGAEGAAGRDHAAAGHAGLSEDAVRIAACQVRSEEEQAVEAGAQAPGSEIEGVAVRGRRPLGPASSRCSGGSASELGQLRLPEHAVHRGGAGRRPLLREDGADVLDGQVALLSQGHRALPAFRMAGQAVRRFGTRCMCWQRWQGAAILPRLAKTWPQAGKGPFPWTEPA